MKLSIVQSSDKAKNKIFISKSIQDLKNVLEADEYQYFKESSQEEEVRFIKKVNGFLFVIIIGEEASSESLRKKGHTVYNLIKKESKVLVSGAESSQVLAFLEGMLLSGYQFLKYFKDAEKKKNKLQAIQVQGSVSAQDLTALEQLVDAVFWARDMVNEPVSFMNAAQLADEIVAKGKKSGYKVNVLGKKQIETLKMGGLLAVNQGSEQPPTFTIIEYKPKNAKNKKPVVLVGKGVVYDTGGLSLKPTPHSMDLMKSDMGGAAAMAATIDALAKNKVPVYVIGLIPATDNRPGKTAYAPGDVVTMFDGTTIEVLNTDAEGRMILADALAYANKYEPELVIDAATLTGAAVRALGTKTAISMGNAKDTYFRKLYESGLRTHDRVFRFPFWDEWKEELKSDIADMKNLGGSNAGMITAGKFLEHFVKYPYIHIDIAGPAFLESADSYNGKGATGAGVRLLYDFLKNL